MINLALRTEYSFRHCFAHVSEVIDACEEYAIGIADDNNTFGHFRFNKLCRGAGKQPIFGVRLMVVPRAVAKTKVFGPRYVFIARNEAGLQEIYALVKRAYERFYYHPFVTQADVEALSQNVIVIGTHVINLTRVDFIGIDHFTIPSDLRIDLPQVAINLNWYVKADDKEVYELHTGPRNTETQTFPQYILDDWEWLRLHPGCEHAIENTKYVASLCENFDLPKADRIRYKGRLTLRNLCRNGARHRGVDITQGEYKSRMDRELELIERHGFNDYFLIVADLVRKAKRKMLVGPSRGSSAGSLVCWLIGITEVDPIRFGLMFERFIDDNRKDLPDIDIDFPDSKRDAVIKTLVDVYDKDHVSHIGTIATLKPRSAISGFAAGLQIPEYETEQLKDSIISRSSGDARAQLRLEDTFTETDVGKEFLERHPNMALAKRIEGHASHAGVHAAGIIVCNEPLTKYGGVNVRTDALMMDKREAEELNLLKIDCLGLRTLSILESVADQIGMPYSDFYNLPLDDQKTFQVFNDMRLDGIFQFQGQALQYVTRQMGVREFDDVAAITALARPGPIHSGGTNLFVQRRTGQSPVEYLSDHPCVVRETEPTYGVIIYQEQLMAIGKEYGNLSWTDVQALRKAASKTLGEEFFGRYKQKFVDGATAGGASQEEAVNVWENIVTFGSWGFNKSHAYGYGLISYWTAWCKAHHPMQFAVANMNHARSDQNALRILRDLVSNDGIEYVYFDPDESQVDWSIHDGKLLGGLMTVRGIGRKKAQQIIRAREGRETWTKSMVKLLRDPITVFTILYPCRYFWRDLYQDPSSVGLEQAPVEIETISGPGEYLFLGKIIDKNLRDLNEYQSVVKRGGKLIDGQTKFLNLIIEDDTGSIVCTINRYRYETIGAPITETAREGFDYVLIKGKIRDKWRRIEVDQILNLSQWRAASEAESGKE